LAYEDNGNYYVEEIILKKPLDNITGKIFLQMEDTELWTLSSL